MRGVWIYTHTFFFKLNFWGYTATVPMVWSHVYIIFDLTCVCVYTQIHVYVAGIGIKYIHFVVLLVVCEIVHFEITSGHDS